MNETTIIDLACELAESAAKEDTKSAIEVARAAPVNEPVQFITGNNFMPPLRAFGRAEDFWAAGTDTLLTRIGTAELPPDDDAKAGKSSRPRTIVTVEDSTDAFRVWETYVETFNEECEREQVYCGCPEYDNALYVVDLKRFESIDEEDVSGDYLHDEWQLIEGEAS